MPYARAEGGIGQPFLADLKTEHAVGATLFAGMWLVWCFGVTGGLSVLAVAGLAARGIGLLSRRLCGGITGDIFGLINEVAEIAFLIAAPALMSRR